MGIKVRRLVAIYIDFMLILYICYYFCTFWLIFSKNSVFQFFLAVLSVVMFIIIFIRKDSTFGYESIGKKIMKLQIYDKFDNRIMDKKKLVDRNVLSFKSFNRYPFMILINNKSMGDEVLETTVLRKLK